ncbi:hypothetical protein MLD38_009033 [Melastoma candidum]|uniref:Uncharacterized protein n=1 Tax=Melastoma candidum TaxID=119954 RepID=A0ACB9RW75_9MYRT|nr:hypothetical protein MLD38_009033 [Melastoma candidum]
MLVAARLTMRQEFFEELREGNGLLWPLMLVGLVRCDTMDEALEFFWKMPSQDVVGWTTLISGYTRNEDGCKKALMCLSR